MVLVFIANISIVKQEPVIEHDFGGLRPIPAWA